MTNKEHNINNLEKLIRNDGWANWLNETYIRKKNNFWPFEIEREEMFIEVFSEILKSNLISKPLICSLKAQMKLYLENIDRHNINSLVGLTDILDIVDKIFEIPSLDNLNSNSNYEYQLDLIISYIKKPLSKILPEFRNNLNEIDVKELISDYNYFLTLFIKWIYLLKRYSVNKKIPLDLNTLHQVLVKDTGGVFESSTVDKFPALNELTYYKFLWKVLYEPKYWLSSTYIPLRNFNKFLEEKNCSPESIPVDIDDIRKLEGIASYKKIFSIIDILREDKIISENHFEEGIKKIFDEDFSEFRNDYLSVIKAHWGDEEIFVNCEKELAEDLENLEREPKIQPLYCNIDNY